MLYRYISVKYDDPSSSLDLPVDSRKHYNLTKTEIGLFYRCIICMYPKKTEGTNVQGRFCIGIKRKAASTNSTSRNMSSSLLPHVYTFLALKSKL